MRFKTTGQCMWPLCDKLLCEKVSLCEHLLENGQISQRALHKTQYEF